MQYILRSFLLLLVLIVLATVGKASPETARAELEDLMKIFPSMYWYASDACMRETSRAPGQLQTPEEFAGANKANITEVKASNTPNGERTIAKVDLVDPQEPKEHFIFQFVYDNNRWNTYTAYKYFGSKQTFDLYEADFFMGSMKPYIQKGLDAFAEKKDYKKVYSTK